MRKRKIVEKAIRPSPEIKKEATLPTVEKRPKYSGIREATQKFSQSTFSNYNINEKDLFRISLRLFEDDHIKPSEISVLTHGELRILTSLLARKFDIILT